MSDDSSSPTFAELWRATLNSHRKVERWRALRVRSALVAVLAFTGLVGYALARPDPAPQTQRLSAAQPQPAAVAPDALRTVTVSQVPPVRVIFDADVVNSIDDTLALAMLHGYVARGMVDLLAVTASYDDPWVGPYLATVNAAYGHPQVPIGVIDRNSVTGGRDAFHRQVAQADGAEPDEAGAALTVLRHGLAAAPDNSVVIVSTGHATNLAQLLDSPPDDISALDGRSLVAAKVKVLALTAGDVLRAKPEHNTAKDPASARLVLDQWPTPVVVTEWQVGADLPFPGQTLAPDSPVTAAAILNGQNALLVEFPYDPPSTDLATVLSAVEPEEFFTPGQTGRLTIDDQLIARFQPDPEGPHRLIQRPLDAGTKARITNRFVELVSDLRPHR